ncbi:hypothetical protein PV04_01169 [Phialophora macrospora]|uniref:Uncharacterized protein n=1 Tax=Phialophora macrospora TaxID=1851006 RepID=A0A0D2GKY7_9EURO|nr:hypothetical protein PV04_01169 [Phialophora macrospora]
MIGVLHLSTKHSIDTLPEMLPIVRSAGLPREESALPLICPYPSIYHFRPSKVAPTSRPHTNGTSRQPMIMPMRPGHDGGYISWWQEEFFTGEIRWVESYIRHVDHGTREHWSSQV